MRHMHNHNRNQRLARLLKARREEMALSQRAFARLMGFRQATLSQWELGKTEPDIGSLEKIAEFLGYSMEELWAYLNGKDADRTFKWDLNKMLDALDTMPSSDVLKIVTAGAQKLAKAS